jgi:hypothetical protein
MEVQQAISAFMTEWYWVGFCISFVAFYLYMFFVDRGVMKQDGTYGVVLVMFSLLYAMFWVFGTIFVIGYLISQIPRAINWFIDSVKKEILPSSFDNWT